MGLVSTLARSFENSNLLGRKFKGRSQHVPHRSESQRAPPVVYDGNGKWKYVGESQIHASVYFQHKQTWTPKGARRYVPWPRSRDTKKSVFYEGPWQEHLRGEYTGSFLVRGHFQDGQAIARVFDKQWADLYSIPNP